MYSRQPFTCIAVVASLLTGSAALAAAALACPLLSGGGSQTSTGDTLVIGQFAAGFATNGSIGLDAGAIPCWYGGAPLDCPGDIDGDGGVNLTDLAILLSDFDCTSGCVGDVDGDDDADLTDLAILLANFDLTCP